MSSQPLTLIFVVVTVGVITIAADFRDQGGGDPVPGRVRSIPAAGRGQPDSTVSGTNNPREGG